MVEEPERTWYTANNGPEICVILDITCVLQGCRVECAELIPGRG